MHRRPIAPAGFRFAVKLPRAVTHDAKLRSTEALLDAFIAQAAGLGAKLGVLLANALELAEAAQAARRAKSIRKTQAPMGARRPSD